MLIYQNTTGQFISDVRKNVIADIMTQAFASRWGRAPGAQELNSWQNSLSRMRDVIELAGLNDNYIALEYEVPYNQSRIDCLLFGSANAESDNVVLVELKQWSSVEALPDEGNFVETYVGGGERVVPHPSQQVKGYHNYLMTFISEFEKPPPLRLFSCAYCHNYVGAPGAGLFAPSYRELLAQFPIYRKADAEKMADKLGNLLKHGLGKDVFNRFMRSPVRPCLKLLTVLETVKGEVRREFSPDSSPGYP